MMMIQVMILMGMCLGGAHCSLRTHTYTFEAGHMYNDLVPQKVFSATLGECVDQCSKTWTSCFHANYDKAAKLCYLGDGTNEYPTQVPSANYVTIGRPIIKHTDCRDIQNSDLSEGSGIYSIYVPLTANTSHKITVYCDMETDGGGWMVFQRRQDGSEDFYRGWDDYKNGFGNVSGEYWVGLENLHIILDWRPHYLRIDLEDYYDYKRYARYSTFNVQSSAYDYRLYISGYTGNTGDSMRLDSGKRFSTKDRDNDGNINHCAEMYKGAWWHGSDCTRANLNGKYMPGLSSSQTNHWYRFRFFWSLKYSEMKIRPKW